MDADVVDRLEGVGCGSRGLDFDRAIAVAMTAVSELRCRRGDVQEGRPGAAR